MTEPKIGIYGIERLEGGVYNVLSSFETGLHDALKSMFYEAEYMYKYHEKNIIPDLTIAFNGGCSDFWDFYMKKGIPHIMWSVDSLFLHIYAAKISTDFPNFIFACVSNSDIEAVKYYVPYLPFIYLPHAVDPNLWKPNDEEKEHDIIFLSSIIDLEEKINEIKQNKTKAKFDEFMTIYEYALQNPDKSFWDIYNYFVPIFRFDMNNFKAYYELFNELCYTVTYARRINLIKNLKDFNVKIWGSPVWEKYISGNTKYMGIADIKDSLEIVPKSKICLHLQPMQISSGLHERVLNAACSNSFVISDDNKTIKNSFGDTFGYYNSYTFENIAETVSYYLNNEKERAEKANRARQITLQNHTWRVRAKELFEILKIE